MKRKFNWQVSPEFGVCDICGINDNVETVHAKQHYYVNLIPSMKCCSKCGFVWIYDLKKRGDLKQIQISWSVFNLNNWNYDKKGNRREDNEAVGTSNKS